MTMNFWLSFFLFACVATPATSTGRRCEFLARPSEVPKVRRAGHVNGTVQLCAYTDCCMGFFKLDGGQPRPDLLGCGMMNMQCPEPSCSASKHMDNYTKCVCSSDLCNANMTWMPQSEESQRSSSLDLWRLGMAAIALGTLLLVAVLYVAAQWRQLFKDPKKKPSSHGKSMTSPCSCDRIETSDLDLTNLEIQELLGQGSFASVWQGCLDGTPVAVKAFPAAHAQKFIHERKVFELPLMEHSSLVQYLGAGRELRGGERVLVLELAEHGSLKNFLSLHTSDWRSSLKLAQFLTQGLAFLHSDLYRNGVHKPPVAHCDLSSSNVLVRSDGSCALCDFGCSTVLRSCSEQPRWHKPQETAQSRAHVGTLRYMSPEILEGYVNLQSGRGLMQGDVYSLGLLLWELWRRCSDLYRGSPVPEHHLPYEAELGPNPSLNDLLLFVSEKRERPLLPKEWERFSQVFSDMKDTLEDCWDHDPEARLTAQCAADRITALSLNCLQ